jgi:hypothetical protein
VSCSTAMHVLTVAATDHNIAATAATAATTTVDVCAGAWGG